MPESPAELRELDRKHLWHPYAPIPAVPEPYLVDSAQGVRLRLADGRELVDGMSSWWAAIHGYRHPVLDDAVRGQLTRMAHVMFGGLTHSPAIRLAERLVSMAPPGLRHVFFTDSGSVAVEVAIKMCLQYWRAHGHRERRRLLTVRGGYHGDTFGAMAVCDPVGGMHSLFQGALAEHVFVDRPPAGFDTPLNGSYADQLRAAVKQHARELAGVIVEPVVQGAGGMHFYSPAVVHLLREVCDEHGLLLVLDEIATGFGRTGALFASEHAGVAPDVMCVGKALTGGYLPLAATLTTERVFESFLGPHASRRTFFHGHTYTGNPLACAAAIASLRLMRERRVAESVPVRAAALAAALAPARDHPHVGEIRQRGLMVGIELVRDRRTRQEYPYEAQSGHRVVLEARKLGAILRPLGNVVVLMPPLAMTEAQLRELARITRDSIDAAVEGL